MSMLVDQRKLHPRNTSGLTSHLVIRKIQRTRDSKWLEEGATRILLKRNDLDTLVSLYHDQMQRVSAVAKKYKNKTIDDFVLDKSDHLIEFKKKSRELTYEYEFSYEKMQ